MVNEPRPWQMTVEQLRELLKDVPGDVVVGLRVTPPGLGAPDVTVIWNLKAEYRGGPVFLFAPLEPDDKRQGS